MRSRSSSRIIRRDPEWISPDNELIGSFFHVDVPSPGAFDFFHLKHIKWGEKKNARLFAGFKRLFVCFYLCSCIDFVFSPVSVLVILLRTVVIIVGFIKLGVVSILDCAGTVSSNISTVGCGGSSFSGL